MFPYAPNMIDRRHRWSVQKVQWNSPWVLLFAKVKHNVKREVKIRLIFSVRFNLNYHVLKTVSQVKQSLMDSVERFRERSAHCCRIIGRREVKLVTLVFSTLFWDLKRNGYNRNSREQVRKEDCTWIFSSLTVVFKEFKLFTQFKEMLTDTGILTS